MSARGDYPFTTDDHERALQRRQMLDEIDRLRDEVERATRARRTLTFTDTLPSDEELGGPLCPTCRGTSVVCVAGPDRYGNYDADDCPTCAAPGTEALS